jgi:hypothetical protein
LQELLVEKPIDRIQERLAKGEGRVVMVGILDYARPLEPA